MQDRHPLLRVASLALPLLLLIGGCAFFALSATFRYPNGELRIVPSPLARADGENHVSMVPLTTLRVPESVLNFSAAGPILYAAMTRAGFMALDISDLENPVIVNHVTLPPLENRDDVNQYVLNMFLIDDKLIALDRYRGICMYEASDPLHPEFMWSRLLPGAPGEQAIDLERVGDYLFLACGGGGLLRFPLDLTPEVKPLSVLDRFDHTTDVNFMDPNWLLASDGRGGGLQIVGVEDPDQPRPLGNVTTWPVYLENIVIRGKHVYASTRGDRVMIAFNLEHPETPYMSSFMRQDSLQIRSIAGWKDRYILLGNDKGLIEIFDTIDAEFPRLVSMVPSNMKVSAMFIRDDILYAANWEKRRIEVFRLIEDETLTSMSAIPS